MYFVSNGDCYQGATLNQYVNAAKIPDSRQCAGLQIRNQGGIVGTCASAGFSVSAGNVSVDTCHAGPLPFAKWTIPATSTAMYFVQDNICYEGATQDKFVKAAAVPDSRQCAGPEIRNQGAFVGTCSSAGFNVNAGSIQIDTCHLGPIPFGKWTIPATSTPMYFLGPNDTCYQGATQDKFVKAAAIPDGRQCAGPEIRNVGGIVGTCAKAGWAVNHGNVQVDTCHLGPIPFGKFEKAVSAPKVAVPVTKEMINGEVHHCAVIPAVKAAPASTVKKIATKVKTLMNLAALVTVDTPATKVCSKDLAKVTAKVTAVVHPAKAAASTKAVAKKTHSGATYLATGAAAATLIFMA